MHRLQNDRVLPHPEVIVAAPNRNRLLAAIVLTPCCIRKLTVFTLDIDKRAIAAFIMKALQTRVELCCVIQAVSPPDPLT